MGRADAAGVPILAIDLSWDHFTTKTAPLRRAAGLSVWNETMKRQAVEIHGYLPEQVCVAGVPQFDIYARPDTFQTREAFLRRIPYKIEVIDPTLDEFTRIFELNCTRRQIKFHQVMVAYLQRRHYLPNGRPLRACHPRDLLDQVTALCRYRGLEPVISRELLDAAW